MHHPVGVSSWLQQSDKTVGSIHKKLLKESNGRSLQNARNQLMVHCTRALLYHVGLYRYFYLIKVVTFTASRHWHKSLACSLFILLHYDALVK